MLSTTWTGSLKQTHKSKWTFYVIYLPCQFSWWSLNFLKIRLASAEIKCLNCQKIDIRAYSACLSVLLGQVFVFSRLISKAVLEWVLLITQRTLNRSTNHFSINHPTLSFWLRREGRQMPNTEQLLYQTEKSSFFL